MTIQDMIMVEIIKKAHSTPQINSMTCYNHVHPLVYPIEYEECPGCGYERITRITLGMD
ncbi:MAG: hypothetical protein JHC41_08620 [Nitrosopumilus sp.]|jgi:hypothetical protein|nr:hypothetical protein [Nitrosopumilus sp.]